MFCPKCGSILVPKIRNKKKIIECSCGYKENDISKIETLKEVVKPQKEVEVVDEEVEIYPETDEKCSECGHDKAYFWTVQTRAGDESETKFLKCKKCKHTWRDYS